MSATSPPVSLKIRILLAAGSIVIGACRRSDGTVNRRLINLIDLKVGPSPTKPIGGVTTTDVTVDSSRNIWFRLFTPCSTTTTTDTLPVIFYFHGGGFVLNAPDSILFDDFCRTLARQIPAVVISVNYRLSPEHRFPCQYDDGFDALKFIDKPEINSQFPANADLSQCFIAGDSAGGNLAHHVTLRAGKYQEFRQVKLIGLIAIQPFFGSEERTESEKRLHKAPALSLEMIDWYWKSFLPQGSDRDHPAVNVCGPRSVDISGVNFPSTLLIVGGLDPLQDSQKHYYERLKKSGKQVELIDFPKAFHGFYAFTDLPERAMLVNHVKDFVQKQLSK